MRSFQFTTSQGGRPCRSGNSKFMEYLSIHDLSRRSTLRIQSNNLSIYLSIHDLSRRSTISCSNLHPHSFIFQFTTSQGGRPAVPCSPRSHPVPFNSRPLKEVDVKKQCTNSEYRRLSIHDLSRRSTTEKETDTRNSELSIHDLSRRSTYWTCSLFSVSAPFNSRPLKEVDSGGT